MWFPSFVFCTQIFKSSNVQNFNGLITVLQKCIVYCYNGDCNDKVLLFINKCNRPAVLARAWIHVILEWPQHCSSLKYTKIVFCNPSQTWLITVLFTIISTNDRFGQTEGYQKCLRHSYQFFIYQGAPVEAGLSFNTSQVVDLVIFLPQLHHSFTQLLHAKRAQKTYKKESA